MTSTPSLRALTGPDTVPPPPPELAGCPDYEVIRELGRGSMGVVFLAEEGDYITGQQVNVNGGAYM